MKTIGKIGFIVLLMISFIETSAQESLKQRPSDFIHRISVGGYVGLQVGNITGIVISPEVKIRIIDQLYGGVGFTYQYYWYKNYLYNTKTQEWLNYSSSVYGGRIFFRYYLRSLFDNFLGNIFAHTEYEYLYSTRPYKEDMYGTITDWTFSGRMYSPGKQVLEINSIFIGGGYSQPVGGRAFVDLLILFNLNDSYNSPYSNPVFRIGFGIGL